MKPLLYDGCCKAGGTTRGYQRAGFEVWGCDIAPQPNYCGDIFYQMDILDFLRRVLSGELPRPDAIHVSPPCQFATDATRVWRAQGREYPNLIPPVRELLQQIGVPYVIENVPGAAGWLIDPLVLNGGLFGMNVHRVRLFECSFPVPLVLLPPMSPPVKMGRPVREGEIIQPVGHFSNTDYARRQMGVEWMTQEETAQAVPPAYTEFIGKQLITYLDTVRGK